MSNEVTRLRRLRKTTLKLRAFAQALGDGSRDSVFDRASVLNWRIARIATGQLRAHPYQSYQRDQGLIESAADLLNARLYALAASLRGRALTAFLEKMTATARELDDARSLTLSADLSDALGRAQDAMRALIDEVRVQICRTSGGDCGERRAAHLPVSSAPASPYLAL